MVDAPASHVVFWQDERAPRQALVEDGLVRAVRVSPGGERQILCFFWPGDTVTAAGEEGPRFTAETVTRTRLRWLDRDEDRRQRGTDRILHELVGLLGVMAHSQAPARLAWFLLRMRPHLPTAPACDEPDALRCLVPRADMADHLGMAAETVCRLLGELQDLGIIALPTRKSIRFLEPNRLAGWPAAESGRFGPGSRRSFVRKPGGAVRRFGMDTRQEDLMAIEQMGVPGTEPNRPEPRRNEAADAWMAVATEMMECSMRAMARSMEIMTAGTGPCRWTSGWRRSARAC